METVHFRSYQVIGLYVGSPQLVVLEIFTAAVPLLVKLRGYPTENENPRGRKSRGACF